jgi:predicted tellurium resistance membrane protein TerC
MDWFVGLIALAAMEIVLGVDNIVFLAIVTSRLPENQRPLARRLGLLVALVMRIGLVFTISYIMLMNDALFHWTDLGIPASLFAGAEHAENVIGVSIRDLILVGGGLFLIGKSVYEIHHKMESAGGHTVAKGHAGFGATLLQVMFIDLIFSLDSVITAVGMVDDVRVMVAAIVIAVGTMMLFANPISDFVSRHPTLTMLALSFLILIGVMLVAEGIGTHINKGYIYVAMAFSLCVEMLNLRVQHRKARLAKG